ncbi:thiol reductant ABC exporter subunit CydC [Thermogemmatispora aurantia]|uniref:Thiol reductant ABC exporter subunit CydC n=1 Tax=Thermogemmatispora aurantia TaxID=2045279 RepID=A0A5J4KFH5_9CHLR|nr:thiol reductant ABC exporter subunit CydC [Thermogemmatispora aurantia]GER85179.1 thiol reductant ABC exporter subunit CydC [Thermogemmatispora aurantia]
MTTKRPSMRTAWRLLAFLRPFTPQIIVTVLLGGVMVAANMLLLSMASYLIAGAAIVTMIVLLSIPITIVRLMGLVRAAARYGERLLSHNVTFRLLAHIRVTVYRRLAPLAPARLFQLRSGDLLARLVSDVDELQNLYLRVVAPVLVAALVTVITCWLLAIFNTVLALAALFFLLITGLGLPLLALRLTRGLGREQLALRGRVNMHIVESLQGMSDLLAYGQAARRRAQLASWEQRLDRLQRRLALAGGLQEGLQELLTGLAVWSILLLAIPLAATRQINSIYLGFLAMLVLAAFEAITPLAQSFGQLGHSLAAGERLFSIIDTAPAVSDPEQPAPIPATRSLALTFEDVTFRYEEEGRQVTLANISFHVPAGGRVAIVGPSGAGKSTLLRLVMRFWDPQEGHILLAGQDIRSFALADLRSLMGVVTQDTYLFNDTIRGNLRLAAPSATEGQLWRVLELAQLDDFVRQLPAGLDTWVGEQGLKLSGGERQRLAIARALLKDAPLLLLDEVTANLDRLTEQALFEALDRLMQGRTTLLVTHRLLHMEQMDEILVVDGGRIVERGRHEQLLAQGGLYRRLWEVQNALLPVA